MYIVLICDDTKGRNLKRDHKTLLTATNNVASNAALTEIAS